MHVRAERLRKVKSPLDSLPHLFNKA